MHHEIVVETLEKRLLTRHTTIEYNTIVNSTYHIVKSFRLRMRGWMGMCAGYLGHPFLENC